MDTLLRGSVGVSSLKGVSALPRLSLSRDLSRGRFAVTGATRAHQTEDLSLVDCPPRRTDDAIAVETKNNETPEFVLFPCDEDTAESNSLLLSVSPLSVLALAALPGAEQVTALFAPYVELVRSWDLPEWLIHWGHPGNMAVVLFAMGGYGTYLGWQIRVGDDMASKATAKDLHPKLFAGLFFFFSAGALGGITSILTQGKSVFESNHALTGLIGLALLAVQTTFSTQFEGKPELRSVHAYLGSGIMALFLVHAALGLQLGLRL